MPNRPTSLIDSFFRAVAGTKKSLPFILITNDIDSFQIPPNGMEMQAQEDEVIRYADKIVHSFNSRIIFARAANLTKLDGHTERGRGKRGEGNTLKRRGIFTFF